MLDSMKGALEDFSRAPASFMLPTFLYPLFILITLGASVGVLLLIFLVFTALGVGADIVLILLGVVGAALLIVNAVFSAGYKGALYNEYYKALRKETTGLVSFMNYSFRNSLPLFTISLAKIIILGFLLSPLALITYFVDLAGIHEVLLYLVGATGLFIWVVVEFLFAFSYIAYVTKRVRPFTAILVSLNFIKDVNVRALLTYMFYCIIVACTLVPLLNIVVYLVFYPIAASSLIRFFEGRSGSQAAA